MQNRFNFETLKIGQDIPPLKINITSEKNKHYNRIVKEINPLHYNLKYAKSLGYKNIVIAGVFTYSFFTKMIKDWLGKSGVIKNLEIFFKDPAYENDLIIHKGKVLDKQFDNDKKLIKCEIWSENKDGVQLARANINVEIT